MKKKTFFYRWLMNPGLLKFLIFFRPRHLIIRFYSFLLSSGGEEDSVVDIVGGYGRGLKVVLNRADKANPQNIYYWLGLHEPGIQRLFARFIKPGSVVYDVGSYIGVFSLLAARLTGPKGRVYAFEPLTDNIERIKLHASLNGMQNLITCVPSAILDKSGNAPYYDAGRKDWGRIGEAVSPSEELSLAPKVIVETISLDEFVFLKGNPAPDLIKIDVEGREGKVLAGSRELLKKFKPVIICEVHYPEASKQVYEELSCLGYEFKDTQEKKLNYVTGYCGHILALPPAGDP